MKIKLSRDFFDELKFIIFFIVVLNLLDALLTIVSVFTGNAVEANPLMAYLITYDPLLFMICKQLLVSLGAIILWRFRQNMLAIFSIFLVFLIYYVNLIYHLRLIHLTFIQDLIH